MVYVDNASKFLDKDITTIYGTVNGIKTYSTTLGACVIIPLINVKYVDIN